MSAASEKRTNRRLVSASARETRELGRRLSECLLPAGVVLLHGAMGAGKTVLTQGIAEGLGVDPRRVQSPTFTLVHELPGTVADLVHIDLYRLDAEEIPALGLEELLAGPGVKVVEWAERLSEPWPGAARLGLEIVGEASRALVALDTATEQLLERIGAGPHADGDERTRESATKR